MAKVRIRRSDLAKLGRDELYDVAKKLKKVEEAAQAGKLEDYVNTAHIGQLEFHKAKNRVRLFLGGNRCVRGDQRVWTLNGLKPISQIDRETLVYSYDPKYNQPVLSLASAAFIKGRGELFRVVHEKGEFVAHGSHLVFLGHHGYVRVEDLELGYCLKVWPFQLQQSPLKSLVGTKAYESVQSHVLNSEDSKACDGPYTLSKILAIESVGVDDYWDIQVANTNNYLLEDGTVNHNSGKTTAGAIETLWRNGGIHPFIRTATPIKSMILVQDFQTHAKDIIIPKLKAWAPRDFFTNIEKNQQGVEIKFHCKSGSIIDIKSQDQEVKIFEGSDYDYVWIDEPCQQNIFTAIFRGLTDRGGLLSFTGTPLTFPWIADLYNKASLEDNKGMYWSKFVNTYDNATNLGEGNESLGRQRIKEFESTLGADERAARIEGKFLHLQGLIFKEWNRGNHLIDNFNWPSRWPIWVSIDPAQAKPWAVSWIGFTPSGSKILIRSDLVDGVVEDIATYLITARDEIELDDPKQKPLINRVLIDNAANVDSMIKRHTTITEELNAHIRPLFPSIESGPKNVKEKINIFKMWLKPTETSYGMRPGFFVFKDGNERFLYEIERYSWKTNRGKIHEGFKETPVKRDDDIIDTVLQVALIVGSREVGFNEPKPLRYTT